MGVSHPFKEQIKMTTDSDKTQESSDDAKNIKESPVAPKTKITVDKATKSKASKPAAQTPPAAPEPAVVTPPAIQPLPVEQEPPAVIPPVATPAPAVESAPVVPSKVDEKKEVIFRSIRAEFTCCLVAPKTAKIAGITVSREPAETIRFKNHIFTTSNEKTIEFLRKIINSNGTDSTEIFEMPEIDELLHGNVAERLERMTLSELRQVAGERGVTVMPTDSEIDLCYKLLKKLLGTS